MRRSVSLGLALSLALCCAPAFAAQPGQSLGFVIKTFVFAMHDSPDNCPAGMAVAPKEGIVDIDRYLASIPPADAAHLRAFPRELHNLVGRRGPNSTDVCEHPTSVPDPGMRIAQGKIADGFNLDGTSDGHATAMSCAHEKFTDPSGAPGIDNQLFRAQGCIGSFYSFGAASTNYMRNGFSLLLQVTGVTDPRNDPDVEVGFYLGVDKMMKDASGSDILPDATFQIADDPKFQTIVHGKIVDGVLSTEPADIPFLFRYHTPPDTVLYKNARLRLELLPDGNAKGTFGAYVDWRDIFIPMTRTEALNQMSCDAYYYALKKLADGYPDPKTGQCTAISAAYDIEAVRAFLYRDVRNASAAK